MIKRGTPWSDTLFVRQALYAACLNNKKVVTKDNQHMADYLKRLTHNDVWAWLGLALRAWAWLSRAWASKDLKPGPRPNCGPGSGLAWPKPGL